MTPGITPDFNRLAALIWTHPAIDRVRDAASLPVYLVGGAIRDSLADFQVDDLDLVVEGDPTGLALELDPAARINERFGTVNLLVEGYPVDIATARTESYPRPGALPEVKPGTLEDDLRRRDFTINAMAIVIDGEAELVDRFGRGRRSRIRRAPRSSRRFVRGRSYPGVQSSTLRSQIRL